MSLLKKQQGTVYEVYPMEITRAQRGTHVTFDRDTRGRSWCILEVISEPGKFIPLGASGLITADGQRLTVGRKYE